MGPRLSRFKKEKKEFHIDQYIINDVCDCNGKLKETLYDEWFDTRYRHGQYGGWIYSLESLKSVNRPINLIFKNALMPPGKVKDVTRNKLYYEDDLIKDFLTTISEKEEYIMSLTFKTFSFNDLFRDNVGNHCSLIHELLIRLHHLKKISLLNVLYDIPENIKKTLVSIEFIYPSNLRTLIGGKFIESKREYEEVKSQFIVDQDIKRHVTFNRARHLTLDRIKHIFKICKYDLPKVYLYTLVKLIYCDLSSGIIVDI